MKPKPYPSLFRDFFGPTGPLADCGEDPYIQYLAERSPGGGGFVATAFRDPRLLSAVLFALLLWSPLPWPALAFVFLGLIAGNMKPPAFTGFRVPFFVYLRGRLLGETRMHLGLWQALERPRSLAFEDWRRVPLPGARAPAIVLAETIAVVRGGMRWRMFAGALVYVGVEFGAAAAIAISEDRPVFLLAIPGTIACGALVLHPAFRYLAYIPVLERFKLFVDPLLERSGQDRSGSFASRVTPLDMQGTMFFPTMALFISVFVPFALPALWSLAQAPLAHALSTAIGLGFVAALTTLYVAIAGRKNSDRIATNLIAVAASQVRVLGADWSYHYKMLLEDADEEQAR